MIIKHKHLNYITFVTTFFKQNKNLNNQKTNEGILFRNYLKKEPWFIVEISWFTGNTDAHRLVMFFLEYFKVPFLDNS